MLILLLLIMQNTDVQLRTKDFISELIPQKFLLKDKVLFIASETSVYAFSTEDGELLKRIGGTGDGPGQFQLIMSMGIGNDVAGDMYLIVNDPQRWDLNLFRFLDRDGQFDLQYIGRFNRVTNAVFETKQGFAITDLRNIGLSQADPTEVIAVNKLQVSDRISWANGLKFHPFSETVKLVDYGVLDHFFLEVANGYYTGFSLEQCIYHYDTNGKLIRPEKINLYRFIPYTLAVNKFKDPHEWYSKFSSIKAIWQILGETYVYYSVPKQDGWKVVSPRLTKSLPTIANHDYYIQKLPSTVYQVPEAELVLSVGEKNGQIELSTIEMVDTGFDPAYHFRVYPIDTRKREIQ